MGRNKTYDRDDLIERSMEMFRDHGYAGTSTQMLVDGLGVNRYSLYAEFGDKQTLFDAALERYFDEVIEPRFSPLEAPEAGIDEVRGVFEFYASQADGAASGRGCLLCNTAIELGPDLLDVVLGFDIRRDALVTVDGGGAGVVGCQGKRIMAVELIQQFLVIIRPVF